MPSATQKSNQDTIKTLYNAIGLSTEEVKYLFSKGYHSAIIVLSGYYNSKLQNLEDKDKLPKGCVQLLTRLVQYIQWKQDTEGNLKNLNADSEFLKTFDLKKVLGPTTHQQTSTAATVVSNKNDILVHLSDYPKFSGRQADWTKFNKCFKAVIGLASLKEVLDKQLDHKKQLNNPKYKSQNNLLHAILMHCVSKGLALHQVKKYKSNSDGHSAYHHLYKHYQGYSNKVQCTNALLTKIMSLSLSANTPGGMDMYLNEYAQEFAFHGKPLSEAQKVTMLLNGIKNCQYSSLKTFCCSQNFS